MRSAAHSSQSLMYLVSRHSFRNVSFVMLSKETQLVQERKKGTDFVTIVLKFRPNCHETLPKIVGFLFLKNKNLEICLCSFREF